jgi:hypothetical protein
MRIRDLVLFAVRALLGHRLRTVLSLAGMAIGVGAVILLTSLGEGARRYVTEQFASIGSNLIIVFPGRNETTGFFPGAIGVPHDLTLEDVEAILRSVHKTNRAVYVEEGWPFVGIGAQVVDTIQDEAFDFLDAPVVRVTQADVPMPYNKALEKRAKPSPERVVAACNRVLYR